MSIRAARPTRAARGMALVGTMVILMFVLAVLLLGIAGNTGGRGGTAGRADSAMRMARRRGNTYLAQGLSETGIRLALQWLNQAPMLTKPATAFAPSNTGRAFFNASASNNYDVLTLQQGVTGNQTPGTIKVRFYPYSQNSINSRRLYIIEAIGEYMGIQQVARVVVAEKTFAHYAYFSDNAPTNWWVSGNTAFNGPVHINAMNSAGTGVDSAAQIKLIWKDNSTSDQIFRYNGQGSFTTSASASQVAWYQDNATNPATPSGNQWNNVLGTGQPPECGVPQVKMPSSSTAQRDAALGPGGTAPGSIGVSVPNNGSAANGGVYIEGDVSEMNLRATGTGSTTQVMDIFQEDAGNNLEIRTTVTINLASNTTTIQRDTRTLGSTGSWTSGTASTYTGATNGVVYCNGNIGDPSTNQGGLSGVVANNVVSGGTVTRSSNFNIVTESSKTINIDGGIVYADLVSNSGNTNNVLSNATAATATSGTMGLVANTIKVVDQDSGGNPLTDVSVHATVFAYNTFNVTNPDTRTAGAFKLLGGYIVKNNGKFGTFNASTLQVLTGFVVTRLYDSRAATNPPAYFPNEDNEFQVTSFQRVVNTLQ